MARPRLSRTESRARTRTELLASALQVFAERGFEGASVEEICENAGYSRGAFYSNFTSKDDLLLALFDERMATSAQRFAEALAGDDTDAGPVRALHVAMTSIREQREWTVLDLEFWLYAIRNKATGPDLTDRFRLMRRAFAAAIEATADKSGIVLPAPADELAGVVFGAAFGVNLQHLLDPGDVPADLLVGVITRLMPSPDDVE